MIKRIRAILMVLCAAFCIVGVVACQKPEEPTPELAAPTIEGQTEMTLYDTYADTHSDPFTVTGDNVTVTVSGDEKIAWNNENKWLDIAAGLQAGEYPVVLTASNGNTAQDATANFKLTVLHFVAPKLEYSGEKDELILREGYTDTASEVFTVEGTNVSVGITEDMTDGYAVWNNTTKKLDVAEGLAPGTYSVTLTATNGTAPQNAVVEFVIVVLGDPGIHGPAAMSLAEGYEATQSEVFTVNGDNVTVTASGNEKITWNNTDKKLDIAAGLAAGTYSVTLTASNGDPERDATCTFMLTVKKLVEISGTFAYGSGRYEGGKFTQEGDTVTVTATSDLGSYTGTVEGSGYTITVPEGANTLTFTSNYFHDLTKTVEITDGQSTIDEVTFNVPKLTGVADGVYTADGYNLAQGVSARFKGGTVSAGEGFFVRFTMPATEDSGWFNRGGILIEKEEGTSNVFTIAKSGEEGILEMWGAGNGGSNWGQRRNTLTNYTCQELTMTIAFYQGAYYVDITGVGIFLITKPTDFTNYNLTDEFLSTDVVRYLGVGYGQTERETSYQNVSYGIGDAAAQKAIDDMSVSVTVEGAGADGTVTLTSGDKAIQSGDKVLRGSDVVVTVTPAERKALSSFKVNNVDELNKIETEGSYTIQKIQQNTTITVAFETVPFYKITGSYTYAMGGDNEGDELTVMAGAYKGTVDTSEKTFEVEAPKGTYTVTLSSSYFYDAKIENVTVEEAAVSAGSATFNDPRLAGNVGVFDGDVLTLQGSQKETALFAGNVTAANGEGFVLKFTMPATTGDWFNRGIVRIDIGGDPAKSYYFTIVNSSAGVGKFGIRENDWAYNSHILNNYSNDQPIMFTVAFKGGAYYIDIEGYYSFEVKGSSEFYSTSATRKLGLGCSATPNFGVLKYKDIYYAVGDEAAQQVIDNMKVTLHHDYVGEDGSVVFKQNGEVVANDGKAFHDNVTVTVTPNAGKMVSEFTVNGENKLDELKGGVYTIEALQEDLNVHVAFTNAPTYTVTGSYSYASGRYDEEGNITNADDEVTVRVGSYDATVNKGDRTYSVEVPVGTYNVVLSSKAFCDVTVQEVKVTESGATVQDAKFTVPKLVDESNVTYDGNTIKISGAAAHQFAGSSTAQLREGNTCEGMFIKFTTTITDRAWFTGGGCFIQMDDTVYSITILKDVSFYFSVSSSSKGPKEWVNRSSLTTDDVDPAKPITVCLVYYNGVYYVQLGYTVVGGGQSSVAFMISTESANAAGFLNANKARTFGLHYPKLTNSNERPYTDVAYGIGDEIAQKMIEGMKVQVNLDQIDAGYGSAKLYVSGNCYASETEINSGDKVFIGSTVRVDVTLGEEYSIDDIEVNEVSKKGEIQGTSLSVTVSELTTFKVSFKKIEKYTVTGTYTYTSGRLEGEVYKNDDDTITVTSGQYSGTGSGGTWSIDLPVGEHNITVESKMFRGKTIQSVNVQADSGATVSDPVKFTVPKFVDGSNVTYTDNGFTLVGDRTRYSLAASSTADVVDGESEGMFVKFTTTTGRDWGYNAGGCHLMINGVEYNIIVLVADGSLRFSVSGTSVVQQWANVTVVAAGKFDATKPVTLTYVYYKGANYVQYEYTPKGDDSGKTAIKLATVQDLGKYYTYAPAFNDTDKKRTLGFGCTLCAGANVSYTDISYGIGDEAALKAIQDMGLEA